ncbi:hypothetical protein A3C37_03780 [Candidatus Peribacteria bacterium RIFCSPHIGHO2_02_FULL_53_20]|nr:MAG: hypothetical protein A3C37_03780 [Candidatus Peribacteria bacterium RIFCSPHIGHO2_02_FULL_53_20]OGJ73149.1 MAG: hypothetical protein A3G69_05865 [Candidatus Peribacteria bacterium RIFCSPLOWO2_12_FULL_53_10]
MKYLFALFGVVLGVLPMIAAEAAPFPGADPCTFLGGAQCGTSTAGVENLARIAINSIATFLAVGGGALAVIYTVIGGFQMLLSFGDEGKFTRGRTSVTWALVGFGLVLGSQMIVNYILGQASMAIGTAPLLKLMEMIVNSILGLLNVFFVIIIMAAGVRAIIGRGKQEEFTQAKHAIGFAIAGALIINLARALATATFNILGTP